MLSALLLGAGLAFLVVEVHPPQEATVKLMQGGNYACLNVQQQDLGVNFQSKDSVYTADVSQFMGMLVTVMVNGKKTDDCADLMINAENLKVRVYLPTSLSTDTVVLQIEEKGPFHLLAEFNIGSEYCIPSYLQHSCQGAEYSTPADFVEMITINSAKASQYVWFVEALADELKTQADLSKARFKIKYYSPGSSKPIAALRQPYYPAEDIVGEFVSYIAFCSNGNGDVTYFSTLFSDKYLHNIDNLMPERNQAEFPDTRYCDRLKKSLS